MAELNLTPIGHNAQIPQTMSAADLVSLARGVQQYKREGISLNLEQEQERERNLLKEYLSEPTNYMDGERLNIDKLNAAIPKIAPLTGGDVLHKYTNLANAQTQAINAKQNLTQEQRSMIAQRFSILGRLGVQEKEAYLAEMDLLKKENPENKDLQKLIDAYKITWQEVPSGPQLPSMAIAGANSLLSPAQQQQSLSPQAGTIDTGAATFQTVTKPSVAGEAPSMNVAQTPLATRQLAPSQREVPTGEYDINNQPIVNVFDANGRFLGQRSGAGTPQVNQLPGAQQQRPSTQNRQQSTQQMQGQPVARVRPGETTQTMQKANDLRVSAMDAAQQVPMQTFNNNQIIKVADEAVTGKGAGALANLTGGYAIFNKLGIGGSDATALQKLGDYMAKQQVTLAQTAGIGGSDAGRELAAETVGSTGWTPEAIKHTARVNRALSTATELFNEGVQNAFSRTNDPFAARDFQNRWSQAADINSIRLYDAIKNNDKEAIREVVTAVGGPQSDGYKSLSQKIKEMQALIKGE